MKPVLALLLAGSCAGCLKHIPLESLPELPAAEVEAALLEGLRAQDQGRFPFSLFRVDGPYLSWTLSTETGAYPVSVRIEEIHGELQAHGGGRSLRTDAMVRYNHLGERGERRLVQRRWHFDWKNSPEIVDRFAAAVRTRLRAWGPHPDRPRGNALVCPFCGEHGGHHGQDFFRVERRNGSFSELQALAWRHERLCLMNERRVTEEALDRAHAHADPDANGRCDECSSSWWPCGKSFKITAHPAACGRCR